MIWLNVIVPLLAELAGHAVNGAESSAHRKLTTDESVYVKVAVRVRISPVGPPVIVGVGTPDTADVGAIEVKSANPATPRKAAPSATPRLVINLRALAISIAPSSINQCAYYQRAEILSTLTCQALAV